MNWRLGRGAGMCPEAAAAAEVTAAEAAAEVTAAESAQWREDPGASAPGQRVLEIETERIVPNPAQPRKNFPDEGIIRLSDSIRQHGILQPLTVRQRPDGRYELVAGERRLRAARMAGLPEVPCLVVEADGCTSAEWAIIENLQREDLNMFESAEAIGRLIGLYGLTQEQVAERLSCSQSAVANKLRLLRLTAAQRGLILSAGLTERHARALLRLKESERRDAALRQIIGRALNVAATEELVERMLAEPGERPEPPRRKFIMKDVRLFYNSIDRAVEVVRRAGVAIEARRQEKDDCTEILIKLPREGERPLSREKEGQRAAEKIS